MTLQELRKGISAIRDEIASIENILIGVVFDSDRLDKNREKISDHLEVIKNTAEEMQSKP